MSRFYLVLGSPAGTTTTWPLADTSNREKVQRDLLTAMEAGKVLTVMVQPWDEPRILSKLFVSCANLTAAAVLRLPAAVAERILER